MPIKDQACADSGDAEASWGRDSRVGVRLFQPLFDSFRQVDKPEPDQIGSTQVWQERTLAQC